MDQFLTIEPAPEVAAVFALWCLNRDARVQTVSVGGFLVPLDWYRDIPAELLDGAYVDGFRVDGPRPSPVAEKPAEPRLTAEKQQPARKPRTPRKRGTGARTRKPSDVAAEAAAAAAVTAAIMDGGVRE